MRKIVVVSTTKVVFMAPFNEKILENLKTFGLTDYEAKAYSALVSLGTSSVTEVSQLCDVPRSNLYAVLEKLNTMGFVEIQKGRPILFKARDPKKVLEEATELKVKEIEKAKAEVSEELQKITNTEKANVEPSLIWGIRGQEAVITKVAEIIKRSKGEIMINVPNVALLDGKLYEHLEQAKGRGVKIRIATEEKGDWKKFQKVGIVRTRDKIYGLDVLADQKEVLVAPSIAIVAAWVDNPEMALHVKDFLDLVWKDARVMK